MEDDLIKHISAASGHNNPGAGSAPRIAHAAESPERACRTRRALSFSASTQSMRFHRKPAKAGFRWVASISCKMAFSQAKTLILRPEIDIGSNILLPARGLPARPPLKTSPWAGFPGASGPGDVHAAACGLKIEGLRALRCIPGFVVKLRGCRSSPCGSETGFISGRD